MNRQSLSGLKVIDIATMMAAPWAATYLADFGADVIKVEHPQKGDTSRTFGIQKDGIGIFWKTLARNKKAITLNISSSEGREILVRLIQAADILIENFRPGTLDKWGLSYKKLKSINPKIIVLRVSGFGQKGPYSQRSGFGTIAEGMSGFAAQNGYPDSPPTLPPLPLADGICSIFAALSIMIAVYERDVLGSGQGQEIDISLYESMMRLMECFIVGYNVTGSVPGRIGNRLSAAAPRNVYQAKDGQWVSLSASNQPIAEKLFKGIGREDLINDPRFINNPSRVKNVDELDEIISEWISSKDGKEALDIMSEAGAAVGPIYDMADIFTDLHIAFRQSLVEVEDKDFGKIKMPNVVAKFSRTPGSVRFAGPQKGEHNEDIYSRIGLTKEDLLRLKESGVI